MSSYLDLRNEVVEFEQDLFFKTIHHGFIVHSDICQQNTNVNLCSRRCHWKYNHLKWCLDIFQLLPVGIRSGLLNNIFVYLIMKHHIYCLFCLFWFQWNSIRASRNPLQRWQLMMRLQSCRQLGHLGHIRHQIFTPGGKVPTNGDKHGQLVIFKEHLDCRTMLRSSKLASEIGIGAEH